MTLKDLFEYLSSHPNGLVLFSVGIPVLLLLIGFVSGEDGALAPWKYIYSFIIYLVCVPGIFVVMLDVYLFLFERQSVWNINLYTQVLPILTMIVCILIIKRFVSLDDIPGFDRINGLVTMIAALLIMMWFIEKTQIFIFTYMPFSQVLVILVICLVAIRFAWRRLSH